MLVLEDGHGGVDVVCPTWTDRVAALARSERLDRALATGASPDSSVRLSLRARRLTQMSTRRSLARAARQLVQRSSGPRPQTGPAPFDRDTISNASPEFSALADRLVHSGPVAARGVARTAVLLSEAWGPAYRHGSHESLRTELLDTIAALNPVEAHR